MRSQAAAALLALVAATCDGGLKPEPSTSYCGAGICGTVHFIGAVPDSTDWVRVVVYAAVPDSIGQLTQFAGFSDALPPAADTAPYACCITQLAPGAYGWVLVVWKKVGILTTSSAPALLREGGASLDPSVTTRFGAGVGPPTSGASGIDMVADYGHMRRISDFFPAAAPDRRQSASDAVSAPPARSRRGASAAAPDRSGARSDAVSAP